MHFKSPKPVRIVKPLTTFASPIWLSIGLALWLIAGTATAQTVIDLTEDLDSDRPEAWSMRYFTSISLLSGLGSPEAMTPGSWEIGFEGGWVPSLSETERRVGFDGRKTEDLNKTSVFGRPRVTIGLPKKFSLTLAYAPPVEVGGVKPNLISAAIGRPFHVGDSWRFGWRLYGQTGTIKGDFTCDSDTVAAGNDPQRNPFRCEAVSNDEVSVDYASFEISTARRSESPFEPHFSVAVNFLDTEFQVNALYFGVIDRTLQRADDTTVSLTAGLSYRATDKWRLTGELFYSPLGDVSRRDSPTSNTFTSGSEELFNVRGMISYRVR